MMHFFQASLTCVLVGLAVWGILRLAAWHWPALAMQRSVWLLAQCIVAASFLLSVLPRSEHLSMVQTIEVIQYPAADSAGESNAAPAAEPSLADLAGDWMRYAATAWLALYATGLLWSVYRQAAAYRRARQLLAASRQLSPSELDADPAFASLPAGLVVRETELALSPMLIGALRPQLLLPAQWQGFSALQRQLILEHELTHARRGDPSVLAASAVMQALLWFNPVMPALGKRLSWAQELSCDGQVLRNSNAQQRHAYASALVTQLKLQHQLPVLAFGGRHGDNMLTRVGLIRGAPAHGLGRAAGLLAWSAMFGILGASVLLQPAYAWRVLAAAEPAQQEAWRMPLEHARITSTFGVISKLRPKGHRGIDFAARKGTPVTATADGTVIASTDLYDGQAKFGKIVLVQHANNLRSFYAHLDERSVQVGDHVAAGAVVGRSGSTGAATGPHLHLEVWQGTTIIDPAKLLP